jgi:outer membrane protein OmpA-like peptidoglycan-associated protein
MKNPKGNSVTAVMVVATAVAAIISGCASVPKAPPGSMAVRNKLVQLRSETSLSSQVPVAIDQAEIAVKLAETSQPDAELAAHRVYLADRLVDTVRATAETRFAESQRLALRQQADAGRLAARTREADAARGAALAARSDAEASRNDAAMARNEADTARMKTEAARNDAAMARSEADAARMKAETARNETEAARVTAENARIEANATRAVAAMEAETARKDAERARMAAMAAQMEAATAQATAAAAASASEAKRQELGEQIALLQARTTERGIVLTLGDVLFATGSASLKPGAIGNLDRLVVFMNKYADRTALVEGHTDDVGSNATNEELSLRRANSVRGYLTSKGIAATRLASFGKGEMQPVAANDSAEGRQQNRRVEVVIENERQQAVVIR